MARIGRVGYAPEFQFMMQQTSAMGDRNDCTVKALALVADITYEDAHARLAARGRKNGRGWYMEDVNLELAALGFKVRKVSPAEYIAQYPGQHKNLKNVTTHHPRRFPGVFTGNYIFRSHRHVSAVVNGKLIDWAVNKAIHVWSIYEVTK